MSQVSSRRSTAAQLLQDLHKQITETEAELERVKAEKQRITNELVYIKREDVLDDAGRQKPILIQSNESALLEQLQVKTTLETSELNYTQNA